MLVNYSYHDKANHDSVPTYEKMSASHMALAIANAVSCEEYLPASKESQH